MCRRFSHQFGPIVACEGDVWSAADAFFRPFASDNGEIAFTAATSMFFGNLQYAFQFKRFSRSAFEHQNIMGVYPCLI